MTDAVLDAMRDALDDARPQRLGVAVSGGGDSMAALDAAIRIGQGVKAVTVDHGLRPEAAQEAAGVAAFCAARAVPHDTLRWHWDGASNVSARARSARFDLIGAWAAERGIDTVILGHTQDDLAETFLMRLSRGSGLDGLSAMAPLFRRAGVTWLRPMLGVSRSTCREVLRARGIGWIEDPTNDDPAYLRTRARNALADLGIDAATLAGTARRLSQARAALDAQLRAFIAGHVVQDRGDLLLPADPNLPTELRRRLIVAALRWTCGGDYPPRQAALQAAMDATGPRTLAGCTLTPEGGHLRIAREYTAVAGATCPTTAPWDGRWTLHGPHDATLHVGALGDALPLCPDWRATGLPRASLRATPAVWHGDTLVAAPLAGLANGWEAQCTARGNFADFPGTD